LPGNKVNFVHREKPRYLGAGFARMKFISLFTKTPQHQRFQYRPRYYDPQKEEMQERESRIRRELRMEQSGRPAGSGGHATRIAGSFQAARRRSSPAGVGTAMIRLGVLLFITVFLMAFLTWGKPVLYSLLLFVPVYFYFRFKNR
jgi:hypothetical protein